VPEIRPSDEIYFKVQAKYNIFSLIQYRIKEGIQTALGKEL
jgi:hypothetical protein